MTSKTLLIVDDALIIREMIKDAAVAAGWEILGQGTNGQEGVELYQKLRPTAMTLDLVMPEYDGLHALKNITALDPDARIVVVSALEQRAVLKEAFKLGASDFLVKPFDKQVLVDTLEKQVTAAAAG
jgi:two-component system chemotaxis response regulator CheY